MEHVEELNGAEAIVRRRDNGDMGHIVDASCTACCPVATSWNSALESEVLVESWWMEGENELCEDMDAAMQRNVEGAIQNIVQLDHNYNMEVDVSDSVSQEEEEADIDRDLTELLQASVLCKDIIEVRRAIMLGANVNERMAGIALKETPIMRASRADHVEIVDTLIKAGADVHCVDSEGMNALMVAASGGSERTVELLIQAGSDVNAVDRYGKTALMLACEYRSCIEFCMRCLFMEPRRLVIEAIVAAGGNVNAVDRDKNTSLILACKNNQEEASDMIEFLLDVGAQINRGDYAGMTPLMHAVRQNASSVICMLLCRGADVFQRNFYGEVAADFASADSENAVCIGILLMRAGARLGNHIIDKDRRLQAQRDICVQSRLKLSHLCREEIRSAVMRRCAGGRIEYLLRQLPLPSSVREYIADQRRYVLDV